MHENVFKQYPTADISGSIVWIPILENDSLDATVPSVKALSDDRIKHYYDSHQALGKTIAASVGWPGKVAWDIYLFYGPTVMWAESPPKPESWMHQLSDDWAKNNQYRTGIDLKNELSASLEKLAMGLSIAVGEQNTPMPENTT